MTASFPTSIPTTAELRGDLGDNVSTLLSAGIGAGDTTINVDDTSDFPSAGLASLVKASGTGLIEVFSYTGKTATSFTGVTRNFNGKGADSYAEDDGVHQYWVADMHNRHVEESIAVAQYIGDCFGLDGPQTLLQQSTGDVSYTLETTETGKAAFIALKNFAGTTHEIGIETDTDAGGGRYPGGAGSLNLHPATGFQIAFSTNATLRWTIDTDGDLTAHNAGIIRNGNGSAAFPAYGYDGDVNTGDTWLSADAFGAVTGGGVRMTWENAWTTVSNILRIEDGTVSTPGWVFNDDPDNGPYRTGSNAWSLAAGATRVFSMNPSTVNSRVQHGFEAGTTALPGIHWTGDSDTGFRWVSSGFIEFVRNDTARKVQFGFSDTVGVRIVKDGLNEGTYLNIETTGLTPGGSPDTTAGTSGIQFVNRGISINSTVFFRKNAEGFSGTTSAGTSQSGAFQITIGADNIRRWIWTMGNLSSNEGVYFEGNNGSGNAVVLRISPSQLLGRDGSTGTPTYSFINDGDIGMTRAAANNLGLVTPTGGNIAFYEGGVIAFRYDGGGDLLSADGKTTKTVDLGTSAKAWDDVWADDFQNVADIPFFDHRKDSEGKVHEVDDIQIMRDIKPLRNEKGELVFNENGYAFWDDNTLPQWLWTRKRWKKNKVPGPLLIARDPDGKPWIAMKVLAGLALGVAGQLVKRTDSHEMRIQQLEKELKELKEAA